MMNSIIGENAGKIWSLLDQNGEMEFLKLIKLSKIKKEDFYMALGWLARENKIAFCKDDNSYTLILMY